jgi:V/A-type H+-transporting ATPase subunit I
MLHLDLICVAHEKDATLKALRELGVVHVDFSQEVGEMSAKAKQDFEDALKVVRLIQKSRKDLGEAEYDSRPLSVSDALLLEQDKATLIEEKNRLNREIKAYEQYGDFDVSLADKLLSRVEALREYVNLPEKLPQMRLSKMKEKLARVENRIRIIDYKFAIGDDALIIEKYPQLADRVAFEAAKESMSEKGVLAYLSGWVPSTKVEELKNSAKQNAWGLLLREKSPDEIPPTLVEPPRFFKSLKVLFEGLGIAPAYTEADVSVPFMCYFSLFFAMLVGDGAYGAIFLAGTLFLRKKLSKSWFVLMSVFSVATIFWGVISNTWFGAQIPLLSAIPSVAWLSDPSYKNMMLLCFTIGVSHLMLARIWNGICKFPDSTSFAEFGWAGVLLFMYIITNSIVGIFSGVPQWAFAVFGVSIVLVFLFTVKPSNLKTQGAELGMLPLNIMSALGDIISYVRLFAVGLASVKVAQNFNSMATSLLSDADGTFVKIVMSLVMVMILVLGHALNLAMAGLSILVHAVRLNTLEFSNHKGISWAGILYNPFKNRKK